MKSPAAIILVSILGTWHADTAYSATAAAIGGCAVCFTFYSIGAVHTTGFTATETQLIPL